MDSFEPNSADLSKSAKIDSRSRSDAVHIVLYIKSRSIRDYVLSILEKEWYDYSSFLYDIPTIEKDSLVIVEKSGYKMEYTSVPEFIIDKYGSDFEIRLLGIMTRRMSRSFGELFFPRLHERFIFTDQMHDCDSELRVVFSEMLSRMSPKKLFRRDS